MYLLEFVILTHRDAISVDNKCLNKNFNGSPCSLAYVDDVK